VVVGAPGALDDGTAVDTWLLAAADGDPDATGELSGAAELADGEAPIVTSDGGEAQLSAGGGAGADAGQTGPKVNRQKIHLQFVFTMQ